MRKIIQILASPDNKGYCDSCGMKLDKPEHNDSENNICDPCDSYENSDSDYDLGN